VFNKVSIELITRLAGNIISKMGRKLATANDKMVENSKIESTEYCFYEKNQIKNF